MTAAASIAGLDRSLARSGQPITLKRMTGTQRIAFDVDVMAFVRDYTANELVGGIIQGDSLVVIGPTEMSRRKWPAPPRQGDAVNINGKQRNVQSANALYIGEDLVRVEMVVRG